jgi:hypothetical protein
MNRPAPSKDLTWPALRHSGTRTAHPAHRQKPNRPPLSQEQANSAEEGIANKSKESIQTSAAIYQPA